MERGRDIVSSLPTLASIAVKQSSRNGASISSRVSALRLAAAVVVSMGPDNRNWSLVQEEAIRLAEKNCKVANHQKGCA